MKEQLSYQEMVREFMEASGQPVYDEPRHLSTDEQNLRHSLFMEEVKELEGAWKAEDRVEQLDAICDILYVLIGTALTTGEDLGKDLAYLKERLDGAHGKRSPIKVRLLIDKLKEQQGTDIFNSSRFVIGISYHLWFKGSTIEEAFQRVHASNMSKFCSSKEEALATVHDYHQNGTEAVFVQRGGKYVVLRSSDKKVLKSINYTPVDLSDLI